MNRAARGEKYEAKMSKIWKSVEERRNTLGDEKLCSRCGVGFRPNLLQLSKKYCDNCTGKPNTANLRKERISLADYTYSQKAFCFYCGETLTDSNKHLDHIIPISRGGEDSEANLMAICDTCNLSKNNKAPWEYIQLLEQRAFERGYDEGSRAQSRFIEILKRRVSGVIDEVLK